MADSAQVSATTQAIRGFTFYTHTEYRQELIRQLKATKRGDHVLLMTMTFEPTEPEVSSIVHEAELAASRGVLVTFAVDAHSFMLTANHTPGPLLSRTKLPARDSMPAVFRNKLHLLDKINRLPTGRTEILNKPSSRFSLPVAGRSHIKAAIINDQIFLGGCNLQGTKLVDMMIGWKSPKTAASLRTILMQIIDRKNARLALSGVDRGLDADNGAKILIDSGIRGQSLILDEALALIDTAEKWLVITCQFFPNSVTAQHLKAATARGVKIEVVYPHPKQHGLIGGLGQQFSILRERTRVPKSLFAHALPRRGPELHAKLIACDKGVMIGSHNYVNAGVLLGTAEIALTNPDEQLARAAVQTLHRALKP